MPVFLLKDRRSLTGEAANIGCEGVRGQKMCVKLEKEG